MEDRSFGFGSVNLKIGTFGVFEGREVSAILRIAKNN